TSHRAPAVAAPVPTPAAVVSTPTRSEASATTVAAQIASPAIAPTPAPAAPASRAQRVVSGQVYSYMKDGVRHYTSTRPAQVASIGTVRTINYSYIERCFACGVQSGVNFGSVRLNTQAYNTEIAAAAREFGVEEAVV